MHRNQVCWLILRNLDIDRSGCTGSSSERVCHITWIRIGQEILTASSNRCSTCDRIGAVDDNRHSLSALIGCRSCTDIRVVRAEVSERHDGPSCRGKRFALPWLRLSYDRFPRQWIDSSIHAHTDWSPADIVRSRISIRQVCWPPSPDKVIQNFCPNIGQGVHQ